MLLLPTHMIYSIFFVVIIVHTIVQYSIVLYLLVMNNFSIVQSSKLLTISNCVAVRVNVFAKEDR